MKKLVSFALIITCCLTVCGCNGRISKKDVVGAWKDVNFPSWCYYYKDGTCKYSSFQTTTKVSGTWEIDGDTLIVTLIDIRFVYTLANSGHTMLNENGEAAFTKVSDDPTESVSDS